MQPFTCASNVCLTQARLELEVQRLSGELSASERKLDLTASDLAAERDRVAAQAALLERKVQQPAGWEALYPDIKLSLFRFPEIRPYVVVPGV